MFQTVGPGPGRSIHSFSFPVTVHTFPSDASHIPLSRFGIYVSYVEVIYEHRSNEDSNCP
jgi:hypothetical protein